MAEVITSSLMYYGVWQCGRIPGLLLVGEGLGMAVAAKALGKCSMKAQLLRSVWGSAAILWQNGRDSFPGIGIGGFRSYYGGYESEALRLDQKKAAEKLAFFKLDEIIWPAPWIVTRRGGQFVFQKAMKNDCLGSLD